MKDYDLYVYNTRITVRAYSSERSDLRELIWETTTKYKRKENNYVEKSVTLFKQWYNKEIEKT